MIDGQNTKKLEKLYRMKKNPLGHTLTKQKKRETNGKTEKPLPDEKRLCR